VEQDIQELTILVVVVVVHQHLEQFMVEAVDQDLSSSNILNQLQQMVMFISSDNHHHGLFLLV
jgi:hypothetical protein